LHLDSLASQFRGEKDQRAEGDKENERALREQGQAMEKHIRQLSDQVAQLDREISDRLTREAHALHEEIKQKQADLRSTMERMFAELSNVKTDRNLLAGLFIEVAKCLNQDIGKGRAGAEAHGFPN
jgi:predicted  nucleic acid-binding Zn-ribbon protein